MEIEKLPIIPRSEGWKHILQRSIRDPEELLRRLGLPLSLLDDARQAARQFPLRVPPGLLERIEPGNPDDPLLRQVLPLAGELETHPGFSHDPVGDLAASRVPGVLQKYRGRMLLITTPACAVNCRFCFRRHFPYQDENPAGEQWQEALTLLEGDTSIDEVILSGGDPLLLDDERLDNLIGRLEAIPHLKRLRIHTRLPIVVPERVTDALLSRLGRSRLTPVMVLHCNHPNEIDTSVEAAIRRLDRQRIRLLNQSVLLHGVNDTPEVLIALNERLFEIGVLPYYLHLLDRVTGTAHFEVTPSDAADLLQTLRCHLPGYLVPRLVREEAGAAYKLPG